MDRDDVFFQNAVSYGREFFHGGMAVKKTLLLTAALFAALPALAQERENGTVEFQLNFTNFGVGTYLPFQGRHMVEASIELLKIGMEHRGTGIGVEFSPFKFFAWFGREESEQDNSGGDITGDTSFCFINTVVHWNVLSFFGIDSSFYIAPFAAFNYLFMDQEILMDRYVFAAGLHSGIRGGDKRVKYNIFSVETGFRLVEGDAKFFAGLKFDIIMHTLRKQGLFM